MVSEPVQTIQWSVEDYHRLIEAGILSDRQVELIEGDILEMTPEGPGHTDCGEGLANYLRQRLGESAWVREARPITLTDSEPEPDIAIVRSPRSRYRARHPFPEDIFWLIEISDSTLNKDLTEKKQVYARAKIPEYWVIAIKLQQVTIFRHPRGSDYQSQETLSQEAITSLAFPEVVISLETLWSGNIF